MTRVAIIPARGGSVRIPRKNTKMFYGQPMITWPIEAAYRSGLFSEIIVSTDDHDTETIAREYRCEIFRRQTRDDGSIGTQEIAAKVLKMWPDVAWACVIYPCSPMLQADDLALGLRIWRLSRHEFARSVLPDGSDAGCFYFGTRQAFVDRMPLDGHTQDVVLPANRFIDINTPEDWAKAESMFNALRRAPHV